MTFSAKKTVLTVFMLVKTKPEWLALSDDERARLLHEHVLPILKRHADEVTLRYYDIEFYSARVTDIWVWDASSHHAYEMVVEALRMTPLWDRFYDVVEILPGVENAVAQAYNRDAALPAA
ncbi:darcynin family protein [Paraburkholderia sp. BCC1876]|uniref:darcynin family protein n=1 Tax=Paraburkholderia sp. BCC1876 TaxID=2676303 RepID=UPI001591786C